MKNILSYLSYLPKRAVLQSVVLAALIFPVAVFANDAPGSIPYTGASTQGTDHAAFNVFSGDIPGVPSNAGEQDFVTVAPSGTLNWTNNLEICNGQFDVAIYLHNGAETSHNGDNLDGPGVATGVRIKVTLPNGESMSHDVTGTITADNVASIVDKATVHCDDHAIALDYVEGSAQIFRQSDGQFDPLSDDIVGPNGTPVGSQSDNGVVPGCWEYRVIVKLTVKVKPIEKEVPEPIVKCVSLTGLPASLKPGEEFTLKATASAEDATITKYVFDFGDGQSQTVATGNTSATADAHSYNDLGSKTAKVTVHFDADGKEIVKTSDKCVQTTKVEKEEKPPVCPTNPELPADSPKCVDTPPELPNTGIGGVLSGVFGTGALGMSVRGWLESRSMLRAGALRKKG